MLPGETLLNFFAERIVSLACLCNTREYITPGKYSLVNPAAIVKLMLLPTEIHTVYFNTK